MYNFSNFLVLCGLFGVLLATPTTLFDVQAQESTFQANEDEVQRLREEIAKLQSEIEAAKRAQMDHTEKLAITEAKLKQIQKLTKELNQLLSLNISQLKSIHKNQTLMQSDIEVLERQLKNVQIKMSMLQAVVREQAIRTYKHRNLKKWMYLISTTNLQKALKRARMLEQVRRYEARLYNELKTERQQYHLAQALLIEQYNEIMVSSRSTKKQVELAQRRKSELENERKRLESEMNKSKIEITKSRERIEQHQRAIKDRQASLREIENIIAKRVKENEIKKQQQTTLPLLSKQESTVGKALTAGNLSWPVRGEVISQFGIVRDPMYNTQIENPGIEVRAEPNTPVRAAEDGRVITATWMRGFESIIILEHPENGFTVYSRLGEIHVKIGEVVKKGQIIGKVAYPKEGEPSKFHFEVWIQRSKKNPLNYLEPK